MNGPPCSISSEEEVTGGRGWEMGANLAETHMGTWHMLSPLGATIILGGISLSPSYR